MTEKKLNPNFESFAHEIASGMVAGLLIESVQAETVFEKGMPTPYIDIHIGDHVPFPVRTVRIRIERPTEDFTWEDTIQAIKDSGNVAAQMAMELSEIITPPLKGENQ